MNETPCYYDCSCSYFSILFPSLWGIVVCLLMGWAPMLYRVIGCLLFLLAGIVSIRNSYGFILTENDVTVTMNNRILSVTPWEEIQWRIVVGRGARLYLTDKNGKEHDFGNRLWMIRAFFIYCPNPPTENHYPSLAVLKQKKLTEKYILSPCQVKAYKNASRILWLVVGLLLTYFAFGISFLLEMDDAPAFLGLLWLSSIFLAIAAMLAAGWITDRIEHSFAAAVYQKNQK